MAYEDVFAEAEGLKRRRALIEALQGQNLANMPQGGSPKYSSAQGVLRVLNGILGTKAGTVNDQAMTANSARYQEQLGGEVGRYLDTSTGKPGGTLTDQQASDLMTKDQAPPPLPEPVAANPREAITRAMASRFPEMQGVGKAGLAELIAEIKAKRTGGEFKDHIVGKNLIRSYADGRVANMGNYEDAWEAAPDMTVDGKTVKVQKNKLTGEVKSIATGQTINVNNSPENRGLSAAIEGQVKQIQPGGKSFDVADAAQKNLAYTTEALSSLKQGADTGTGAEAIQVLRKLGDRFGLDSAKTAPTDTLSSVLKRRVLAEAGGSLGTGFSNADRDFLSSGTGDLSTNEQAMKRVLAIDAAASLKRIEQHNTRVRDMSKKPGYEFLNTNEINTLGIPMPEDAEFQQMVKNVLAGRPTIEGLVAPQPGMVIPPGTTPPIAPVKSGYGKPVIIKGFP